MANIWISQAHIDEIITDIEEYEPLETGGAFFGYVAADGDYVITDLISAGDAAKRSRYSFEPDQDYQLSAMARLYETSSGRTTYLGDWHSHPVSSPALSRKDEKTLLNVALSKEAQCSNPVMMIFGSHPDKWSMNCVKFITGKKRIWPFYSCEHESIKVVID